MAAMYWYDRCVVGFRLTPVSTKSVNAASVLYQAFRPRPASAVAHTGAAVTLPAVLGLGLLVSGAVLLLVVRRRGERSRGGA